MWLERGVADGRSIIGAALLGNTAANELGNVGLTEDYFRVRTFLTQYSGDARDRATGAIAGDPVVQPLTSEISQNFAGGGILVHLRVVGSFKLVRQEPAIGLGQFLGLLIHAEALF